MLKEFKKFALKGNMIDLAVGVIIGGGFNALVTSMVNDIIMPVISLFTGASGICHPAAPARKCPPVLQSC